MAEVDRPSRIVGILGGMGPAATVDFYDKLIKATPAMHDQNHLRVVIWADPTVPSRNDALLLGGEDPTPWLEHGVQTLIEAGAEIVVVPCNTAHAYIVPLMARKNVVFISMIDATIEALRQLSTGGKIGLLAADAAIASRVYQSALVEAGYEPLLPNESSQQRLMQVINSVKGGVVRRGEENEVLAASTELIARGASTVIAGCTEISVVLAGIESGLNVIDPSRILALRTVECARSSQDEPSHQPHILPLREGALRAEST